MTEAWRAAVDRYREDIEFDATLRGHPFRFRSTWGLFSPREVDTGTVMLLDAIEVDADADCLDLGCGYGPIGLALARLAPQGQTLMVDRDYVAVEYANRNAEANRVPNARAILSNGLAEAPAGQRFDLVASNLPAKVGNEMTSILFADAHDALRPGGSLYLVTLSGMRKFIQRTLQETFGNYDKVHQGRQHTVHLARRMAGDAAQAAATPTVHEA
ncbi:MAG: methyltransferase [Dehalococcoidia bacterium]